MSSQPCVPAGISTAWKAKFAPKEEQAWHRQTLSKPDKSFGISGNRRNFAVLHGMRGRRSVADVTGLFGQKKPGSKAGREVITAGHDLGADWGRSVFPPPTLISS